VKHGFLGVSLFTVAIVLAFVGVGEMITRVSGEGGARPATVLTGGAITVEAGEAIFWGKGKCSTCHAVGTRGTAIRGPNQGETGPLRLPIGARAEERAKARAKTTSRPFTATDYLVESLVDPGAYVVEGFKNEMPNPLQPPIRLSADETRAVIAYLQSLGGRVDVAAIKLPRTVDAKPTVSVANWQPYTPGDPKKGEKLFFDDDSAAGCGKCHRVGTRGDDVGPELTQIAGTRDARFIVESILKPSKEIASGYEPVLIVTKKGLYVTGIVKKDGPEGVEVADSQGRIHTVAVADIARKVPQAVSLMPGNFGEILTVDEFDDLLAFLLTLR
jgi:putative heme-binding domain-containing protein